MAKAVIVLKEKYETICMEWVNLFCKKQDIKFSYWVGNEVGV